MAARSVDSSTVAAFRSMIDHTRRLDRQFGGPSQLDQLRTHIDEVELGEYKMARALDEDTLARWRRVLGEDHPATKQLERDLAELMRELGETDLP